MDTDQTWNMEARKTERKRSPIRAPPAAAGFTDEKRIINKERRQPVNAEKNKTRKQLPQSLLKGSRSC